MGHRAVFLILLALLAPTVVAGSEERPEATSPPGKASPGGDLLAAWLSHDPRGLRITFQTVEMPARGSSLVYTFLIEVHGARQMPSVGWDSNGRLQTDSGANNAGWGVGRLDNIPLLGDVKTGPQGTLSMVLPWGMFGLREGDDVEPLEARSALCCEPGRREWSAPYDLAMARGTFVVKEETALSSFAAGRFPILVPAWMIPTIVLACTTMGLASGWGLARATRRAPTLGAAPTVVPVRAAPPPGSRFQRAPPGRR